MGPHLVVALSSHGYGHIGQTAPVIEALRARVPGARITLYTSAPPFKLMERFGSDVAIAPRLTDVGMMQADAQLLRLEDTAQAYAHFHENWERKVDQEASELRSLSPDLILANIPYLTLAAAKRGGIPAVALCSINWMDIYDHYFSERPEAQTLLEQMRQAYESAHVFLQPVPSMPMLQFGNRRPIGPICQRGEGQRARIDEHLGLHPDEYLVMVSLGGMELRPPVEQWPVLPGMRLIVPASWHSTHSRTVDFESLGVPYVDALWSCDALICKPGYGSFVEAACVGIPVLYLERPEWPEVPYFGALVGTRRSLRATGSRTVAGGQFPGTVGRNMS
jgi:UDP:flavonoid glycosyltransferase YjiC (YdhE family)